MPHENEKQGTPADWLARAKSNLALAKTPKPDGVFWEDMCFNLQQAAEKAIKAVLLDQNVRFPYTHQIGRLVKLVHDSEIPCPAELDNADDLSDYGVEARYPANSEWATEEDYDDAVRLAAAVVGRAERLLAQPPP